MNRKLIIAALALTASPLAIAGQSGTAKTPAAQTFSNTVDANGLKNVELEVKVGKIRITTAAADKVAIKTQATAGEDMHFIFDWTTGKSANALPPGLHLVTRRDGDTLMVSLESDATSAKQENTVEPATADQGSRGLVNINVHGDHSVGWKSIWTVTLPARLALHLKVGVGKATVLGIAGGLDAKIGVGKLDAGLKQGPLEANVGVGDISAEVMNADYGDVHLSAGVGHVEFYVNGQQNMTGFEQHLTASSQKLTGDGKTPYTLKAGVGHIKLKLGVKTLKDPDADSMDSDAKH